MAASIDRLSTAIEYPDADGKPMAESDRARKYLIYGTEVLRLYFRNQDVYVSGNLFIYYEEGNPKAVIAPDVFVVLGVDGSDRRTYKLWEEGNKAPDFVLEITSKKTRKEDCEIKPKIYAALGVREYFQYDPTGDYLTPQLQGFELREGVYQPINSTILPNNVLSISSEVLGLELRLIAGELRFFNPLTAQILLTHEEEMQARLIAEQARSTAEERSQRLAAKLRELNIDPDAF